MKAYVYSNIDENYEEVLDTIEGKNNEEIEKIFNEKWNSNDYSYNFLEPKNQPQASKPETITLYYARQYQAYMMSEQGEGWGLEPYGNDTAYYKGETIYQADFYLPRGVTLGKTKYEEKALFDEKNVYCEIMTQKNAPNHPYLIGAKRYALKMVEGSKQNYHPQ